MIEAKILADSLNAATGDRLTTFQVRVPKWLLAEINTHRALSRNFASSRAIPAKTIRRQIINDPFVPVYFGANQKGMQANFELTGWRLVLAKHLWKLARFPACGFHWLGEKLGLHKQIVNRLLEPWMWADGVISGTEFKNFFALRNHPDAQPEFRDLANQMQTVYESNIPSLLFPGQWHLPFVGVDEQIVHPVVGTDDLIIPPNDPDILKKISSARCARVSYLLRDGKRSDVEADRNLYDRLVGAFPGHWSPTEHPAQAMPTSERYGNFVGFKQFRKFHNTEAGGDYDRDIHPLLGHTDKNH